MLEVFDHVNLLAVIVAVILSFVLGGLWYSPKLFGKAWMEENGLKEEDKPEDMKRIFAMSLLFSFVAAMVFAWQLGPDPDLQLSLSTAVMIGFGYVGMSLGIHYQFAQKSARLWLIDTLYNVFQFLIFGLVLGLWP